MSSPKRRRELERTPAAAREERERVQGWPLYERIEEADSVGDIKAVLHLMAQRLGLDEWE